MQHQADFMINADLIIKQLQCAVCINEVQNPALTKCGHCFCYKCIDETINRFHKCPLCNSELKKEDIFINHHLKTIQQIIEEQRQLIIKQHGQQIFGKEEENKFLPNYKLVQEMFNQAVQQMYHMYESKYIDAVEEFNHRMKELKIEYENKMQIEKQDNLQQEIQVNYDEAIKQIQNSFNQLKQYYADCVQKTLEQFKCEQIDILIQIVLPKQNKSFSQPFKVNSRINSISGIILKHFEQQNDPLYNYDPSKLNIVFCKPQELHNLSNLVQQNEINQISQQYQLYSLNSDIFLASLGQVKQGCIIVIVGDIKQISQKPKECITYKFNKEKKVDYFSCQQCGIHWVCSSCKDFCHQGHNISVYKSQFQPDWACCYCVSKGFCKALNKNTQ